MNRWQRADIFSGANSTKPWKIYEPTGRGRGPCPDRGDPCRDRDFCPVPFLGHDREMHADYETCNPYPSM